MRSPLLIILILLVVALGELQYLQHQTDAALGHQLGILLNVPTRPLDLDPRTQGTGCQVAGALSDHACTPGAVFADATPDTICVAGYTKTVRSVSVSVKKKVYTEYGLAYPQARGAYEADHLIPLELGGNNDIANLFPEAAAPAPGFHEKDLVENFLHQEVCAGRVALSIAQEQIATNWLAVYNALTQDQIQALKAQFKSWAQE